MDLRYSYSPSFDEGWMIGIWLDVEVIPGTASWQVTGGRVGTKTLKQDAHMGLDDFTAEINYSTYKCELQKCDCERLIAAACKVAFVPAPFPWAVFDGARTALLIRNGQVTLSAEWNAHPDEWQGIELLHNTLYGLFKSHHGRAPA